MEPDGPNLIIDTGCPTYIDTDVIIAKVVFDLVVKFFEEEKPEEVFDFEQSSVKEQWKRLKEIYGIIKSEDLLHDHFDQQTYDRVTGLLVEIVQLRQFLWT